ncbi:MAG: ribonuclease III [Nitrospiraceae bacterium]|nr:ribonuclease III [Nitrospiraceae bacterium]
MTPVTSLETVQRLLGYRFASPRLLEEALTHKSYSNERRTKDRQQNERLEFLGDAVLSLIISEHLAAALPDSSEGALSKLKARLVSETSLAKSARRMDLGRFLRLGKGEELSKGREKNSLLADALEALIAAVYLDGGLDASRTFTLRVLGSELELVGTQGGRLGSDDYKTRLQEICQKRFDQLPRYVTVRETGPDHEKIFEVELTIQGTVMGIGRGHSKKEAEQMAAREALAQVMP